jgi:5-methylcytosine-specific restriction endonuclease McrA
MSEWWAPVDTDALKRERMRSRVLRQSPWWKRRIESGICFYCRLALTMDHVVPLGRGGKGVRGNVVPACKDCNTRKKSMLPVEWQEHLDRLSRID